MPISFKAKQKIKTKLPKFLHRIRAYALLIRSKKSYINTSGWMNSMVHSQPLDSQGETVPWMNYAVINFLKERLQPEMKLFEYGSGYSTSFYAKRVKEVTSIEYNKEWIDIVSQNLPDNAQIVFKKHDVDGEYCRSILTANKQYDVIIVDGRDRVNCVTQGEKQLTEGGVVLLDDAHRPRYQPAIEHLVNLGYRKIEFSGLKPSDRKGNSSIIFYKSDNCFNI